MYNELLLSRQAMENGKGGGGGGGGAVGRWLYGGPCVNLSASRARVAYLDKRKPKVGAILYFLVKRWNDRHIVLLRSQVNAVACSKKPLTRLT